MDDLNPELSPRVGELCVDKMPKLSLFSFRARATFFVSLSFFIYFLSETTTTNQTRETSRGSAHFVQRDGDEKAMMKQNLTALIGMIPSCVGWARDYQKE